MKPIEEQKTITIYKCADCGKEHGGSSSDATRAEQCCACCTCLGPTTAEDKKIARGGSPSGFYRRDLTCEWCRVRKDVKSQQDCVRRHEQGVEHAKRTLENVERNLAKEQAELAALVAKRDALPPKPRQPKKENAA